MEIGGLGMGYVVGGREGGGAPVQLVNLCCLLRISTLKDNVDGDDLTLEEMYAAGHSTPLSFIWNQYAESSKGAPSVRSRELI